MKPADTNPNDTSSSDASRKTTPKREVRICPDCDGDGYFVYLGSPGYFSPSFGNYLPTEKLIRCETCNGYGELDPWEDDPCLRPPHLADDLDDDVDYDEAELPF